MVQPSVSGVEETRRREAPAVDVSVVIPVYNEAENLPTLVERVEEALTTCGRSAELIVVDDGSTDGSREVLKALATRNSFSRTIVFLSRNFGQTIALTAGIRHAKGRIIVPMDGDLQNDPADIPKLLERIDAGYDVVSGWRKARQDPWWSRRLPSLVGNWFISRTTGVRLHDYGCSLKAYRREFLESIHLYGEMRRFLPIYASWLGAKVAEVEVTHHPRRHGQSKYGWERIGQTILDVIMIRFFRSFSTKPLYLFGSIGLWLCAAGGLAGMVTLVQKVWFGAWVHRNPLMLVAVFFSIIGIQFIVMGLLAEIMIRTYHESQQKPTYTIKETFRS